MSKDCYSDVDWAELLATGKSKNWMLTQTKSKQVKDLMQDKFLLETMSFFSFIGLQPSQFENCWLVEFSLKDYQQYFHIADRDKAYIDLANRLDDAMTTWKEDKENGDSFRFHLIVGYDYADGIIQVEIAEKGKELIDKLEISKNKQYEVASEKPKEIENYDVNNMDTSCIQDVSKTDTEVSKGKSRLGKVRLGKDKLVENDDIQTNAQDPFDLKPEEKKKKIKELISTFSRVTYRTIDASQYERLYTALSELTADDAEEVVQQVIDYMPRDFPNPVGYLIKSANNRKNEVL